MLEPVEAEVTPPSQTKLLLTVDVVMSNGARSSYEVDVPVDSTLLQALQILKKKGDGFTSVH